MVDFIIESSVVHHPNQWTIIKLRITKDFIKIRRLFMVIYLETQDRA